MHLYMPSPCKVHRLVQIELTGDWGQRLILGWEAGWTQIKYLEMISLREKQGTNPTDQFQPTTIISTINYIISILQKKKVEVIHTSKKVFCTCHILVPWTMFTTRWEGDTYKTVIGNSSRNSSFAPPHWRTQQSLLRWLWKKNSL